MWPCPAGNQAPVLWWEPAYCLARLSHQAHRRRGDPPAARYQTHSNKVRRSVQITLIWPFRCSVTAQCKCLEPPIFFTFCFQGARCFCLVLSNNSPTFLKGFQSFFFGKPGELKRSQQKGGCQETVFKDRLRYTQLYKNWIENCWRQISLSAAF